MVIVVREDSGTESMGMVFAGVQKFSISRSAKPRNNILITRSRNRQINKMLRHFRWGGDHVGLVVVDQANVSMIIEYHVLISSFTCDVGEVIEVDKRYSLLRQSVNGRGFVF